MATVRHVKQKSKWKPVKISETLSSQKGFEFLSSFEELTDYELVDLDGKVSDEQDDVSKAKSKPTTKKVLKKTGRTQQKIEVPEPGADTTGKLIVKKKRKKKKQLEEDITEKVNSKNVRYGKTLVVDKQDVCDLNEEEDESEENERLQKPVKAKAKRKSEHVGVESPKVKKARSTKVLNTDSDSEEQNANKVISGMTAWKGLYVPPGILRALQQLDFTSPTSIQALALPSAIRDRMDIVGAAETGSGKTLAFGIPILHHILEYQKKQEQNASSTSSEGESEGGTDSEKDDTEVDVDEESKDGNDSEIVTVDTEKNSDGDEEDDDSNCDLSPGEDEVLQEVDEGEFGCVKVINNIPMDDLQPDLKVKIQKDQPLIALILEPTRELAIQVKNHLQMASKHTGIRIATIVGGMAAQKQQRILKQCPEIVIATPGRLWELIQQGDPHLSKVTRVHKLVIDEADRMVEKGHFEELTHLLEMINQDAGNKRRRQTFVFSATLTMLHSGPQRQFKKKKEKMDAKKKLEMLMSTIGIKDRPKVIDLTRKAGTAETLTEARINCSTEEKDLYLYYFLKQHPGRTLVFTNSKDCIRRLVSVFSLLQCCPLPLHADMHQRQRLKNLDRFSGNPSGLLLASDVAARGLDIPDVEHVIHYQVPHTIENYVHRSGRTARAMKEGLSVMLVGQEDVRNYRKIIQNLNRNEDLPLFPVEYHTVSSLRPVLNLVRQIDVEDNRFRKKKRRNDWFVKAAEEMDMLLDEKVLEDPSDVAEQHQHKSRQQMLKAQLQSMLKKPLTQKLFSGKYPTKMGGLVMQEKTEEHSAIQKVKRDQPEQEEMMKIVAAHPKIFKKKINKRKLRKEEKRKKKKMKMMQGD